MKGWTPQHQTLLTELIDAKKQATDAFDAQLNTVMTSIPTAPGEATGGRIAVKNFITANGQALFNFLAQHYQRSDLHAPAGKVAMPEPEITDPALLTKLAKGGFTIPR